MIKKLVARIKAEKVLIGKDVQATLDEIGAGMAKASKKVFDPYTSNVYDQVMDDRIREAAITHEAVKVSRKIVAKTIAEMA